MSLSAANANAFYDEVAHTGVVWTIRGEHGFPAPENSGGKRAMPFWSSEQRATKVVQSVAAYSGFEVVPINWAAFCERWVPGLAGDDLLVGVNWAGPRATGFSLEPMQVKVNVEARKQ